MQKHKKWLNTGKRRVFCISDFVPCLASYSSNLCNAEITVHGAFGSLHTIRITNGVSHDFKSTSK